MLVNYGNGNGRGLPPASGVRRQAKFGRPPPHCPFRQVENLGNLCGPARRPERQNLIVYGASHVTSPTTKKGKHRPL